MFECHVTVSADPQINSRGFLELTAKTFGWKTSVIDGDAVLGQYPYFYFTKHNKDFKEIFDQMEYLDVTLTSNDVKVIRKKIELIIYDTKMKV